MKHRAEKNKTEGKNKINPRLPQDIHEASAHLGCLPG